LVSAVISVPKQDSARVPTWAVQNTLVRASAAEFRAAGVQGGAAFGGNAALSGHVAAQGGAGFDDRRDVRSTNNASDRAAVGDSVVGANGATNMNIQGGFSNSTAAGFSGPLGGVSVDEQTAVGGGAAFGAGGSGLGSAGGFKCRVGRIDECGICRIGRRLDQRAGSRERQCRGGRARRQRK
jgi:hypothetical protein